jgi:predicted transcriptional regulator
MRRSRLEICRDVLETLRREEKPTRIMCLTYLSYRALIQTLALLAENGLAEIRIHPNGRRTYHLTERGERLLESLRDIQEFLSKLEHPSVKG